MPAGSALAAPAGIPDSVWTSTTSSADIANPWIEDCVEQVDEEVEDDEAESFDEDFFAHMEEIDLCWRLKNYGYKIMYCPQSTVYHVGGGTLSKINPYKTYLNFRNNLVLLFKNHSPRYFYLKIVKSLLFIKINININIVIKEKQSIQQ